MNTPAQVESLLLSLERAKGGIGLPVNADRTVYMCFSQRGNICTRKGGLLKLVDKFTYLGNSFSSTKNDINTRQAKAWTAINKLSVIWKSDLTNKIKRSLFFFIHTVIVSILLYGFPSWTLNKRMAKKLEGNYTRMLEAVLKKSWKQLSTKQQLYGHLPTITKTIKLDQICRTLNKRYTLGKPFTLTTKDWTTSYNLYTTVLCRYRM